MDSETAKNADKSAESDGGKGISGDDLTQQMRLLELRFEAEDDLEHLEEEKQNWSGNIENDVARYCKRQNPVELARKRFLRGWNPLKNQQMLT